MNGFIVCDKGFEDICEKELKEKLSCKVDVRTNICIAQSVTSEQLAEFAYTSQSATRVMDLIGEAPIDLDQINDAVKELDFSTYLDDTTTFKVFYTHDNDYGHSVDEIGRVIGATLNAKYNCPVDVKNPQVSVYVACFDNKSYIAVDYAGFDLSKRDYRIFLHPQTIRATCAYGALRVADIKEDQLILDPFCGSAIIPIEAAHYLNNKSVHFFKKDDFAFRLLKPFASVDLDAFFEKIDEKEEIVDFKIVASDDNLRYIAGAKKNAKIAEINKEIRFSKCDVEWLDTKHSKGDVDVIVTHIPAYGRFTDKERIEKTYKEFFYQVDYILSKKGKMVLIGLTIDKMLEFDQYFKVVDQRTIYAGQQELKLVVLKHK